VNEEASDKVLEVEQFYNEIRRPVYNKRNDIIHNIPDFWLTAVRFFSLKLKACSLVACPFPCAIRLARVMQKRYDRVHGNLMRFVACSF